MARFEGEDGDDRAPTPVQRDRLNSTASNSTVSSSKFPLRVFQGPTNRLKQLLSPSSESPSRADSPLDVRRQRPRHVPIVIPEYASPVGPDAPITPTDSPSPRTFSFRLPPSPPQLASSAGSRPKYVEIKIPDWIGTKYSPGTPESLDSPLRLPIPEDRRDCYRSRFPLAPKSKSADCIIFPDLRPRGERKHSTASEGGMARPAQLNARTSTFGSGVTPSPPTVYDAKNGAYPSVRNNSQPSLYRINTQDATPDSTTVPVRTPASSFPQSQSAGPSPAIMQASGISPATSSSNIGLSGFVCNVHRTTGREPKPLVGATTTIIGDKLYVFGGRRLSRTRPQLTADLYELDLVKRHWTKLEVTGEIPPPRYFHSVCALGDTKLVCYGGMSPAPHTNGQTAQTPNGQEAQPEIVVMSDLHIFDIPTKSWMRVNAANSPQGRYAHCATILPSSAVFSSANAPLSAIHHNPSSDEAPNQGKIGISLDGAGGAEMVVVGGQDSANHYIEQISVFNLRSLTWTSTNMLGRSCGAYRSVTAPIAPSTASQIGITPNRTEQGEKATDGGAAMLIYSNYNFLDVKLELQLRLPDGTLIEKQMQGDVSPPGLRFPNGGVIDNHFVVSGTFLTSSKQEYALWALDLRTMVWNRIDIGSSTFSQGSWNRGVLWQRRNAFVILGNRKRSLVEDYNHRRINFSNLCIVELEAFGLYGNPRKLNPMSSYISSSGPRHERARADSLPSPEAAAALSAASLVASDRFASGRELSRAAEDLGRMALQLTELSDMEFLAINGERIPVNSRLVARRWGPYFTTLIREAVVGQDGNETATLRPGIRTAIQSSRNSSVTITPSLKSAGGDSTATTAVGTSTASQAGEFESNIASRPRVFFLPHTPHTIQALLHYLYTSSLPPPNSPLHTTQVLCSLLQIARPYQIDGLLEAVIERLHSVLDNRNTAAIFNAAAMAAGGGEGVEFFRGSGADEGLPIRKKSSIAIPRTESPASGLNKELPPGPEEAQKAKEMQLEAEAASSRGSSSERRKLPPLDTAVANSNGRPGTSMSMSGTSASEDELSSAGGPRSSSKQKNEEIWAGGVSAVVGLQKRGLRGLMEGRRIREMGSRETNNPGVVPPNAGGVEKVGLGIG